QSKYDTSTELLKTIQRGQRHWSPHERLGRLVGAFSPLFSNDEYVEYVETIRRSGNLGAQTTHRFHKKLETDRKAFNGMFEPLRTPNPSKGTGITHAKLLCLLSALSNEHATERQLAILRTNNERAFNDVYYRRLVGV